MNYFQGQLLVIFSAYSVLHVSQLVSKLNMLCMITQFGLELVFSKGEKNMKIRLSRRSIIISLSTRQMPKFIPSVNIREENSYLCHILIFVRRERRKNT